MNSLQQDFHEMIEMLSNQFEIPAIKKVFFPPYHPEGQPRSAEFMAMALEDGTVGLSYVLNPDIGAEDYEQLMKKDFAGNSPVDLARDFGTNQAALQMMSLAAINAISQHVMTKIKFNFDFTTDSLGLINVQKDDVVGMVGFFMPLIGLVKRAGAKLVIIEKKSKIKKKFPQFDISLDPAALHDCNKVLSTSTTVLNNSFGNILSHCRKAEMISVIGPTAGYFPDPLFKQGVDVVGGTYIHETSEFFSNIKKGQKWGKTKRKYCIKKAKYPGLGKLLD